MFKTIGRIFRRLGYKKARFIWGCVFAFFTTLFTAMPMMGAAWFLDLILRDQNGSFALTPMWALYALGFMVAMVMGRFLFSWLQATFQDSIAYELTEGERIRIGDVLKRVSLGFFEKNRTGDLAAAVTTDLSFMEMFMMRMTTNVVNAYVGMAAMLLSLCVFSPAAAGVALAGVLLSLLFLALLGRHSRKNAPSHQKTIDDSTAATLEYLRGMPVVKAYGKAGAASNGIRSAYEEARKINIRIEKQYVGFNIGHLFSLKVTTVALVVLAAAFVLGGSLALPVFLMIVMFSFTIFSQVEGVNNATHVLESIGVILDKLEGIEQADTIDADGEAIPLRSHGIAMEHVTFAYDERAVLEDVSFTIPENTTTAIVGPSGGGKTTLCNLIARFYDTDSGSVKVGGVDVRRQTCDSLLANISMVFQNVYLFHDTVANNIRFGRPGATMDEVVRAAKDARCHAFIMALPGGYETVVGDGGGTLSGGEKQRISIARAMLKDAPIVLLDEATASVDPENEHYIQQAISALTRGKTIVVIAHRLATIESADQILVVDGGKIAQRGTHEELLMQDGIYSRFVAIRQKAEGWEIA